MSIAIYKPNAKNDGCACSFNVTKDGTIFLNLIKQASWNAETKSGSFKDNMKNPEKSLNLKFNIFEGGAIINAIDSFVEAKFFHKFEENTTQISFTPWVKNQKDIDAGNNVPPVKAFGLAVSRNSTDKFRMPIEMGEAICIRELLIQAIKNKIESDNAPKEDSSSQQ